MSDENLFFHWSAELCWQLSRVSCYLYFYSLLCSHSTFFASIARLTNQSFLLYKTLGINIDGTIVLHSCFTGTLALKLLVRVCIETRKFYILLPSEPPHCGLTLSSKQEWISTAVAAAPVPSQLFSFPKERSLLTSSVSSERISRICFLHTMVLERTLISSLTWRVWIQRLRVFFLLTLHP